MKSREEDKTREIAYSIEEDPTRLCGVQIDTQRFRLLRKDGVALAYANDRVEIEDLAAALEDKTLKIIDREASKTGPRQNSCRAARARTRRAASVAVVPANLWGQKRLATHSVNQ